MNEELQIIDKLDELIFWTRFTALPSFKALLNNVLRDDTEKIVYELSDGNMTTREISRIVSKTRNKISHVTVANLWKKWYVMNLVMPAQRKGRFKKVVSLEDIGIEVPEEEK